MCGIVGCVRATGGVKDVLLEGLRKLEYRGYDSAGIAIHSARGLEVRKRAGRLDALVSFLGNGGEVGDGSAGMGHTRWATHGVPSDRNAHPHGDCADGVVVVHNGILENWVYLKEELETAGHRFQSETDSEVFAHLIEDSYLSVVVPPGTRLSRLALAVIEALARTEGSLALVVLHSDHPDRLVVARRDSPIAIGLGDEAMYVGSDVHAFLAQTNRALYLADDQGAELTAAGVVVFDRSGRILDSPQEARIDWSPEVAERCGYPHFMLKEIHQQPDVLARTAFHHLDDRAGDVDLGLSDAAFQDFADVRRVSLLACGSALHAGMVARGWFERLAGIPAEVDFASEYRYRQPPVEPGVLAIAVSQSGETADTLGAIRAARAGGAMTLGVCNAAGSSLTRAVHETLLTQAGPEIGVASTKAFMAQLAVLFLVALRLGRVRGFLSAEDGRQLVAEFRKMRSRLEALLKAEAVLAVERAAERFASAPGYLYLGRGPCFPIALEGALKLKELAYVHAEGYPAGEMKHGPIALVESMLPVVVVAPRGPWLEKIRSNMQEVRARGARLLVVGDRRDHTLSGEDVLLDVPEVSPELSPLLAVVPLQLFAYHVARLRGCDIDKPRNLAKSVTVE